ncbi:hypothetical protein [Persephonella sp.]
MYIITKEEYLKKFNELWEHGKMNERIVIFENDKVRISEIFPYNNHEITFKKEGKTADLQDELSLLQAFIALDDNNTPYIVDYTYTPFDGVYVESLFNLNTLKHEKDTSRNLKNVYQL